MIIVRSPVRISFCGGGTDIPAYYEKYEGMVISASINKYIYSFFTEHNDSCFNFNSPDLGCFETFNDYNDMITNSSLEIPKSVMKYFNYKKGCKLTVMSELPPFSGLGGSSSICVNLVKLLCYHTNKSMDAPTLAEVAHHIRVTFLHLPPGKQDEYAASLGGINQFVFKRDGVDIENLSFRVDRSKLINNILLFYTGLSKSSTPILESMQTMNNLKIGALNKVKSLAYDIKKYILNGDVRSFGRAMHESWLAKKKFAKGVSNDFIDNAYVCALNNGAYGGKITGAGGRGFLLLIAPPEKHILIKKSLEHKGLKYFHFCFEDNGTQIIVR